MAQPSTPLEVIEKCEVDVKDAAAVVDAAVKECTSLFKQSLEIVTSL